MWYKQSLTIKINKNLCNFDTSISVIFYSWLKFKSPSLELLIAEQYGVLSRRIRKAARLASVVSIGETHVYARIVKSFQMFGKISGSTIWSVLIKPSDGSGSWYTGLILYSQCFSHLLISRQKIENGVAKVS